MGCVNLTPKVPSSDLATPPSNTVTNAAVSSKDPAFPIDSEHPTSHGVALEYVKSLALNCPSSSLVQDLIGDHDEFCQRLALDTSTSHLLKKQADVYISIPPDCTTQRLAQTLNDLRDNTLFVWLDGRISKTNAVDRSQKYFNSLLEIIKSIGKVMIICST